jgi:hypothetical protein
MPDPKKVIIPIPAPQPVYVKLLVIKNLQLGNVFYSEGHEIEVFHHEAVALMRDYLEHFEVVQQ